MIILFFVVFISMLGFSIMAPLIPLFAKQLDVDYALITLIASLYSLCQFIAAPIWGHISDRFGRKPVLAGSMVIATIGYLMLGFADSLWMLIAARVIGGLGAGNIAAAYAMVSDISTPDQRAERMGKIGSAFGLGFVIGPALGGFLATGDSVETASFLLPALVAASMAMASAVAALLILKETRTADIRQAEAARRKKQSPLQAMRGMISRPVLALLMLTGVLVFVVISVRETVFALWIASGYELAPREIGLIFAYQGLVVTLYQAFLAGPVTKLLGEQRVLMLAALSFGLGLLIFILAPSIWVVLIGSTLCATATGAFSNSLPTLFSKQAREDERGSILGVYQSTGALGRFLGPTFSGALYGNVGRDVPFMVGIAVMAVILGVLAWIGMVGRRDKSAPKPA